LILSSQTRIVPIFIDARKRTTVALQNWSIRQPVSVGRPGPLVFIPHVVTSPRSPAPWSSPEQDLSGFGLQATLVVASAGIATRLAALIALRIAQPIRLGIEQSVQCLLHRAPHHPVEVTLDPLVVNRDDIVQRTRCIV
jgi:hypothetical protein